MNPGHQEGLYFAHRVGILLINLGLTAVVIELVRRGLLKERYALLWLAVSFAGLAIGVFPNSLVWLSELLHFQYLTLLFVVFFFFLMALVLAFSVVLSHLSARHRTLAQELALLEERLRRVEAGK